MSKTTHQVLTMTAGEALTQKTRVKIKSGTTTTPPEVEFADQGEQGIGVVEKDAASGNLVAVRLITWGGTLEGVANDSFSIGATLYAHNDGQISDISSGSSIGIALEAAGGADEIVEYMPFGVLSTTAATVSILDSGSFTTATDVEAALAEIYQHLLSAQNFIGIPLDNWKEATNFDVANIAANGGVLASDSTPLRDAINAATDGAQRILWESSNNDQIITQIPLPPDLDVASDIVLHMRIVAGGTTDATGFTVDSFFNEGDTKVVDTSGTNQTTTYSEVTATIAAADIPAGAQTLTIGLTPVAHTTDTLVLGASWLEYTKVILTS